MSAYQPPADVAFGMPPASGPPRWLLGIAGVLSVIVGLVALFWPGPTLLVIGIMFGAYFVVWGVVLLIRGLSAHGVTTGQRILDIVVALIALFLGLFLIVRPGASVTTAAWALGFWWAFVGAMHVAAGFAVREGRAWNLIWGLIGIVAGIIILASPEIALGTLVLVVGIGLIVQGLLELMMAFTAGASA